MELLSAHALRDKRVAVSVSESADLGRLGLVEAHFRLALGEIARAVLVSGGKLAYGGHLDRGGYTALLTREVQRYSRRDRPLEVYLAWSEHRRMSLKELEDAENALGLFGEIICLDPDGSVVDWRLSQGVASREAEVDIRERSLTALRRSMARRTDGRVLVGGRRKDFRGALPGVLEEAILSLREHKPIFLAGGFGGVTHDIIEIVDPECGSWLSRTVDGDRDPRVDEGLRQVAALMDGGGWRRTNNGLSVAENRQLAATHRPSEVAALVSLGLGRRFKVARP